MNDRDKDAIAEITRQVMEAARLLRDAVVDLNDIILAQKEAIAEQNKILLRVEKVFARQKDMPGARSLPALEKYAEPEFYCILNDREVFEVHGPEDLRPVGSLAREQLAHIFKT